MSQPPAPNFPEQPEAPFHGLGGAPVAVPTAFQQGHYFQYPQVQVGGAFPQHYPPQYMPAPHHGFPLNIPQGVPYPIPPMHGPPFGLLHDVQPPFPASQTHVPMGGHQNVQHGQVDGSQQVPRTRRATRGPLQDIQPSFPGAPPLSQPTRQRPNAEPRPGVFTYQVDVVEGSAKREFTAETDMPWQDFRRQAMGMLEYNDVELVYKVTGDSGRPSHLKTEADFNSAMARVCQKALSARSRPVGLEIRNMAKGPSKKAPLGPKRKRDDDIPPSPTEELNTQLRAFKQLSVTLKCEAHKGHCFVDRTLGKDSHRRLTHAEMTLWAKKISLGEASKYTPPHCLAFDRLLSKRPRHSASSSTVPEVHVTIQNITSDSGSGTRPSTLPAQIPGIATQVVESQPNSLGPSTSSDNSNGSSFEFIPPFFGIPQFSDTAPVTPPNVPATLPRQATPSKIKASTQEASPLEPETGNDSDTLMLDKLAESEDLQPPFTQANKAASTPSAGSKSASPTSQADVFWSSSALNSENDVDSIFPTIRSIIQGLGDDQPGVCFGDLEQKFMDAGITASPQILVLPEHVICVVGELDLFRVRILRNYTRRIILPLLGFINTYDDPVPEAAAENEDQFSDSQDDAISDDSTDDEGQGHSSDHNSREGEEKCGADSEWEL